MKFYTEKDLTEENMAEFWKEIDILEKEAERDCKMLQESTHPKFNSIEEARQFYNAMPFSEWEKNMLAKYGLKIDELTKKYV